MTILRNNERLFWLFARNHNGVTLKFRNVHISAKVGQSFRYCVYLCKLDAVRSRNQLTQHIDDGKLKKLCSSHRRETFITINDSLFYSIATDRSADFSGQETKSRYVHTITTRKISHVFFKIGPHIILVSRVQLAEFRELKIHSGILWGSGLTWQNKTRYTILLSKCFSLTFNHSVTLTITKFDEVFWKHAIFMCFSPGHNKNLSGNLLTAGP